jgi:branched-chain amino acid transport system permease protein
VVGAVVGLPALRVKGIYLGIATLSFGFIVEEGLARWESVTGGNAGMHVEESRCWAGSGQRRVKFYAVCLVHRRCCARWQSLNLLRSATGRAFVAIRDSEISAQSMGIHLRAITRRLSFMLSAALGGCRRRAVCAQNPIHQP